MADSDLTTALVDVESSTGTTIDNIEIPLVATLSAEAAEVTATLADADIVSAAVEEGSDELAAIIGDVQGLRGPRGERGEPGRMGAPGGTLLKRSLGVLSGGRVVAAVDSDYVVAASALRAVDAGRVLGITFHAVSGPESEVVVVCLGEIEDSLWRWEPGLPVFVGARGELTQAPSTFWAFVRVVGVALSATRVFVDLQTPIFQET